MAKAAGVAPSTVSCILRRVEPQYSRHAEETIHRVKQTAARLGYSPSLLAASLRQKHVPYFGVLLEFVRRGDPGPTGGLPALLWRVYEGIASAAREHRRYPVVLSSTEPDTELTDSFEELDRAVRSDLAGMIAAVRPETWERHLDRWQQWGVPCVSLFDHGTPERPRCFVDLDNRAVGTMASRHLWEHGHRRVLCVRAGELPPAVADRIEACTQAHHDAGGNAKEMPLRYCQPGSPQIDPRDQQALLDALRNSQATAVFAATGGATVMTYEILTRSGRAVPGDCSLIGIDLPVWPEVAHVITEIACNGFAVGEAAAKLLDDRIRGDADEHCRLLVDPVLRERASVATL